MDITPLGQLAAIMRILLLLPLTSTWPHLRSEEVEYSLGPKETCLCLCLAVLCTIIMVYKGTSSSYKSVNCIGL